MAVDNEQPITTVVSHVVRPQAEQQFNDWLVAIAEAALDAPGHLSTTWIEQQGGLKYVVYEFASERELDDWLTSGRYAALAAHTHDLSVSRRHAVTGRLARFAVPSEDATPRWKMSILTLLGLYPTLVLLTSLLSLLAFHLPPLAEMALSSVVLTIALTYIILPPIQRWTRTWRLSQQHVSGLSLDPTTRSGPGDRSA